MFSSLISLKRFCGCMSLRTGCLFIGYIELISSTLGLTSTLKKDDPFEESFTSYLTSGTLILLNVLMIIGVYREKKKLLLPWILAKGLAYLVMSINYGSSTVSAAFIIHQVDHPQSDLLRKFTYALTGGIFLVMLIGWYTFLCIYNYYYVLKKNEEDNARSKKTE